MFSSFLKITMRNLYREKMYAIIDISGLSIAIACCLILGMWLHSELTYDRYNVRHKEIFRVVNEFNLNGKIDDFALTSTSLGPMLTEDHPEIKEFVRFISTGREGIFRHENDAFYWDNFYRADDNIFEVFTHDIIYGDPKTALVDPTSIAVSESFAHKYFGGMNPIGETISDDTDTYKITLVFADLPENTHLKYDALQSANIERLTEPDNVTERRRRLGLVSVYTYIVMPESYNVQDFRDVSDSFCERHMADLLKSMGGAAWRSWLQPLSDIHFQSGLRSDQPTGSKLYIYGFMAVAIFILLVACINYMNLATARATRRAKEVGMRKILGAGRMRLVCQFLVESIFFSLISLLLGLILVEAALSLTHLNGLIGKSLSLSFSQESGLFGWMLVFALGVGLLAGIYPALYLSAILPLPALVGGIQAGKGNIRLRQLLVLIQFIITVSVIACTLLMALQMRYISNKSLGFDDENQVIVTLRGADLIDKIPTIEKELSKSSNILGMSVSPHMLGPRKK